MKVITVANQKGGVAKTTTACALISGLQKRGYKVLGIDLDSQGNLSTWVGAEPNGSTALGILTHEAKIQEAIQSINGVDIVPYSPKLASAEALLDGIGKEYKLRESLEELEGYDYVVVDTPPALSILTVNALTGCDYVVIPAMADLFSLQGINELGKTIAVIRKYSNSKIKVAGILVTMFNSRAVVEREALEIIDSLAKSLGTTAFNTKIRSCVKVKEAPYKHQDLFSYSRYATTTQDYDSFITELLERGV